MSDLRRTITNNQRIRLETEHSEGNMLIQDFPINDNVDENIANSLPVDLKYD